MTGTLTDADFKAKVLESKGLVMVDFGAEWCPPCKALDKLMIELDAELKGRVSIYKMDVDQSPDTAVEYDIRGLPVVMLFKDGQPVDRIFGLRPKQMYLTAVAKL